MICFKCHSDMKKEIYNNVIIDFCSVCGGIWLNKNQLWKILFNLSKQSKKNLLMKIKTQLYLEKDKLSYVNLCPECSNKTMFKQKIYGIEIDKCNNCNGIYLDYNELNKIITNYNKQNFIVKYCKKLIFLIFKGK